MNYFSMLKRTNRVLARIKNRTLNGIKYYLIRQSRKLNNEGFSLIELLVVIIIISILASIALPSYLSTTNRARQSVGISTVSDVNRAQIEYRYEHSTFASTFIDLGLGDLDNNDFTYAISSVDESNAVVNAAPLKGQRGITGRVFIPDPTKAIHQSIICLGNPGEVNTAILQITSETDPACNRGSV